MNAGGKWISFIAEGLDIHGKLQLTIQVWYTEKTMGTTFPLFKKEREWRSRPTRILGLVL